MTKNILLYSKTKFKSYYLIPPSRGYEEIPLTLWGQSLSKQSKPQKMNNRHKLFQLSKNAKLSFICIWSHCILILAQFSKHLHLDNDSKNRVNFSFSLLYLTPLTWSEMKTDLNLMRL